MNIVITGASRGVGYATAYALAADSQCRILALSRNADRLQGLQKACRDAYGHDNLQFLPFDLEQEDQRPLLDALESMGRLDVLINNAGLLINKPFRKLTREDYNRLFEVNFFGPVRLIQTLLPYLDKSEHAHVLNISSMGGFQGASKFPGLTGYSNSKAALSNLTECLAEEFREDRIAVNCIALGAVQTEMLEAAFPGMQAPVASEDMGHFLAYFSTRGHQFFNGKVLPVSVSTP